LTLSIDEDFCLVERWLYEILPLAAVGVGAVSIDVTLERASSSWEAFLDTLAAENVEERTGQDSH
jgi:hypothetical protein